MLRSRGAAHLPHNLRELTVTGCARVRVPSAAFADLPELRRVSVASAGLLLVEPYGFSWNESTASVLPGDVLPLGPHPGVHVNVSNATVPELASFAFLGRLDAVQLRGVRVGAVRAFAFASLRSLRRLSLVDCDLEHVESQAFKKFSVDVLELQGGRVRGALPSRAFQVRVARGAPQGTLGTLMCCTKGTPVGFEAGRVELDLGGRAVAGPLGKTSQYKNMLLEERGYAIIAQLQEHL